MDLKLYVRELHRDDEKELRRLLHMYLREDQVSNCLNLSEMEKNVFADAYIEHVIPQGLSVGVFDGVANELLGCYLSCDRDQYVKPGAYKQLETCPQLQKMARFDEAMDQHCENTFPDEKCALLEIMIVDPKVRRRGLSHLLDDRLCELAALKGFSVIMAISLPNYIRSGLTRKGWNFDYTKEMKYADYGDAVTGEKIFKDLPPYYTGAVPMFRRLVAQEL